MYAIFGETGECPLIFEGLQQILCGYRQFKSNIALDVWPKKTVPRKESSTYTI